MITCSFIIHLKKVSAYAKVFVQCEICFGELKEAFIITEYEFIKSFPQLASLTHCQASPYTKKLQ